MKNQPTYYLGIDPGLHGAIAIFDPLKRFPVAVLDMPLVKATKKSKARINKVELASIFDRHAKTIKRVVLEDVHSMPGQGISSTFKFGHGVGILEGVIASLKLDLLKVTPAVWKKQFQLGKNKTDSRMKTIELFPLHADLFARAKDDGRSEALLLAVYGHLRDAWEQSLTYAAPKGGTTT